ncbi:MAG: 50S ribosomal protein P1 [Nanoarchaeota archaeon]
MENIYSALLLHKAGQEVNEENLKKVLTAVGKTPDEAQIKSLVASLKDVDIEKELESASLAVPSGNAGTSGTESSGDSSKADEKKEEKKEEKSEAAAEGLSALFG